MVDFVGLQIPNIHSALLIKFHYEIVCTTNFWRDAYFDARCDGCKANTKNFLATISWIPVIPADFLDCVAVYLISNQYCATS